LIIYRAAIPGQDCIKGFKIMKSICCFVLLAMSFFGNPAFADITVGHVIPLSGVQAPIGKELNLGAKAYIDYINASGGVNGNKINYLVKDDAYNPEATARLTTELIENENAIAMLVGVGTLNSEAVVKSGVLKSNSVAMIGTRAGASSLYRPDNEMIFHLWASYGMEMDKIAKHYATVGLKNIAVVYQDDGYGKDVLNSLENAISSNKLELVLKAPYERGSTSADKVAKQVLADSKVDAIVMISITNYAAEFLKQYRTAGGAKPIIGMSVFDPVIMVMLVGPQMVRGIGLVQVVPSPQNSVSPLMREFKKVFEKYGPKDATPSTATIQGYLSAKVFVEALKAAGPTPSRKQFYKAMESLNVDLGDYPVAFSKTRRISYTGTEIAIVLNTGKLMF
jgi:ABC-type branched-subunit amino acid transport system substrate-binding protein